MEGTVHIRSALISVYHKAGLDAVAAQLVRHHVQVYSTGGTAAYLKDLGLAVHDVADLTGYPSILGGRVKTLHPKVHGGILARRGEASDGAELDQYGIPPIDLVMVDLYPFEETLRSTDDEAEIIEKIDIGGIALIRAAAKNYQDVVCVPSQAWYGELAALLEQQDGATTLAQRKRFAAAAFDVSSHYDAAIYGYLDPERNRFKLSEGPKRTLRYGENPHQQGWYYGQLDELFEQLGGKELSFNNLVDIEGALQLVDEFSEPVFAIIKHTNPCGVATGASMLDAWQRALECDPLSAFGGILACNGTVDAPAAEAIGEIFFEVLIADDYTPEALELLRRKKQRILLRRRQRLAPRPQARSLLNGVLLQEPDTRHASAASIGVKTSRQPSEAELAEALFGEKVCKHLKSNAIAIVKNRQLIGAGLGQTSRIDALRQALAKAGERGFSLDGSVLVSDAFFPFADSVQTAWEHGIRVVVQPGGSMRDDETVQFCETHDMCLIFTGLRHFKH
ncbi:MAG: bifunctional phosphoribosylaminoimidazolecarboxamide formyltransferase/IMP cyclohydrolase [Bacteroidia bacterium]|nr:bifunctional phosphoribosylaminoimidazolecarboxamide formyltransferase/IMP cyclohydrolase [Bacteroidia bacterium]